MSIYNKPEWEDVDCFDEGVVLRPEEEPETVALGDQTVEEVEEIIKEGDAEWKAWRKKKHEEVLDNIKEACGLKGDEPKLSFQEEMSECCIPNLPKSNFRQNVDMFAEWRVLADVKVDDPRVNPQVYCPTKDLMDYILLKLDRSFPNMNVKWNENSWNPVLIINNSPTKISMEKLALAYQGLLNITGDLNAQEVISNIVIKKLKELFI